MSVLRLSSFPRGAPSRRLRLRNVGVARARGCRPCRPGAPLPASIPAQDLVGRWGLAAYHKDEDRARTEAAARGQCRQPYNISRGPRGGIIMHLADQSQPTELMPQGRRRTARTISASPRSRPAASATARSSSFDGRVLVTRFVDPEVSGRYGTSVYVRCGATAPAAKGSKKG